MVKFHFAKTLVFEV